MLPHTDKVPVQDLVLKHKILSIHMIPYGIKTENFNKPITFFTKPLHVQIGNIKDDASNNSAKVEASTHSC